MSKGVYIIDPSPMRDATMGLMPGMRWFQMRLVRGGPLVPVKTAVIEYRDENGDLDGDTQYCVWVNGEEIPSDRWRGTSMIGECEITEEKYNYLIDALAWDRQHAGVEIDKAVDIVTIPVVWPPKREPIETSEEKQRAYEERKRRDIEECYGIEVNE